MGSKELLKKRHPPWGESDALNPASDDLFCLGIILAAGVAPTLCPPSKRVARAFHPLYGEARAILNRTFWGFSMG